MTDAFEAERARLLGLAYRITGSRATAEDLVQEAWLRWRRADHAAIERPAAWLTTATSRLALDHLKAARHQREAYVGPWLPDVVSTEQGPAEASELAESVTIGFLAVLERLSPVERVVFLMADVFAVPFTEIASVVERSPDACRQIAVRARARIRDGRPRFAPTDDEAWQITAAFLTAAQVGDLDSLVALLAPDAVAISDGGPEVHAARRPVIASRIPRFAANLAARTPDGTTVELRALNGQPGIALWKDGAVYQTIAFAVANGVVQQILTVRNPEKLASLAASPII